MIVMMWQVAWFIFWASWGFVFAWGLAFAFVLGVAFVLAFAFFPRFDFCTAFCFGSWLSWVPFRPGMCLCVVWRSSSSLAFVLGLLVS